MGGEPAPGAGSVGLLYWGAGACGALSALGKVRPMLYSRVSCSGPILALKTPSAAGCLHRWKSELKQSLGLDLGKAANNSLCFGCEAINSPGGLRQGGGAVNCEEAGDRLLFPGNPNAL